MPPLAERLRLVRGWHPGGFSTLRGSLIKHFEKHGPELGAENLWHYLRKAEAFRRQLRRIRPTPVAGDTPGVLRYRKQGMYIDKVPDGRIISFGKVSNHGT